MRIGLDSCRVQGVDRRRLGLRLFGIVFFLSTPLWAQLSEDLDDSKFYAESKQVNQFFRRFNGEEDEKGNRYSPTDKLYRTAKLRKRYLATLFNESNAGMSPELKVEFVKDVLDRNEKSILDFHGANWFAEVASSFMWKGKPVPITLFMKIEKDHLGYKWVIEKVYSETFENLFKRDTTRIGQFIHPMSHELEFMTLRKAFLFPDSVSQFTIKKFTPDQLTLFLYEVRNGNLKFQYVNEVKFHFFQVDGWYFELANFNRTGYNTGWLIANLTKLKSPIDAAVVRKYIYHENR